MTVLRIIRHNEVKQTCTETTSHPSLAACAQDVVTTVQQLNMLPMVTEQIGWFKAIKKTIYIYY